jgi:hypothetical protein
LSHRAVLNNAMQYAIEIDALAANPLKSRQVDRPRTLKTVDPRAVVNSDQARRFLAAVGQQGLSGWSRSSAACTTPRFGPRKVPSCAKTTS